MLADISGRLRPGEEYVRAFGAYPEVFNAVYLAYLDAGERSAHLPQMLARLADMLAEKAALS